MTCIVYMVANDEVMGDCQPVVWRRVWSYMVDAIPAGDSCSVLYVCYNGSYNLQATTLGYWLFSVE